MDEPVDRSAPVDKAKEDIDARRRERRARRRMRQAMADAALTAAADASREQGITLEQNTAGSNAPSQGNAPTGAEQAHGAEGTAAPDTSSDAAQTVGAPDGTKTINAAPQSTELARIQPTSLQRPEAPTALGAALSPEDEYDAAQAAREARMRNIRKELRRRRRWRTFWLLFRFLVFVILPTSAIGWYYYEKATDMYVSTSALVFKGGAIAGDSGGGGGLFGGSAGAVSNPAVDLQEFILSRDMLERLNEDHGYIKHFQSEAIDEFHRLDAEATFDDAYTYYRGSLLFSGKIEVSYDITEGIVRMEVVGATPEASKRFSDAIIRYGEERVNRLNDRSRNDGVRLAEANVEDAKQSLIDAQQNINLVQEKMKIFSTDAEASSLQGRIIGTETRIDEVRAQIRKLQTVAKDPNDSRYVPLRLDLQVLEGELRDLRQRLTGGGGEAAGPSLSELNSRMNLANIDLATAQLRYSSAVTSLETAIQTATSQSLYLETVVAPNQPNKSSRPDRLTNTALAFLILFATYILALLTISVIREQAAI